MDSYSYYPQAGSHKAGKERRKKILETLQEKPKTTNKELADLLGISVESIIKHKNVLKVEGKL